MLGTWNIRNFDDNRFRNGERTTEDLFYLAEIISRFDIIAVQEICRDLNPLKDLMRILGNKDYDFIVSDPTEGRGGNDERLGFIFDKNKVWFKGIAGELVLPPRMEIIDGEQKRQFSRTPFMCSFQSSWFSFLFSTVHIYFGSSSGEKYARRVNEIESVSKFLAKRAKKDDRNHILVGDFNIKKPGSPGSNALEDNGFDIVQNNEGSNKDQTKFYDQISFLTRQGELRFGGHAKSKGVLQFFDSIFRPEDFGSYQASMKKTVKAKIVRLEEELAADEEKLARSTSASSKTRLENAIAKRKVAIKGWKTCLKDTAAGRKALEKYYLGEWRTFHASDHLPLWVELDIDFSADYLDSLA